MELLTVWVERALEVVYTRACELGLEFDAGEGKTAVMWLKRCSRAIKANRFISKFGNQVLPYVPQYKYLGV